MYDSERPRISEILNSVVGKRMPHTAKVVALETDLSVGEAVRLLEITAEEIGNRSLGGLH